MFRSRLTATALLVAADAGALVALWPDLPVLARRVAAPRQWLATAGADRVLAEVAGAGLWLAAAWVAAGLLAAMMGRLPGATGAAANAVARWALPAVLRRVVIGSAGLGVLLTPVAPLAAGAQPPSDGPGGRPTVSAAPLPGPSWPGGGDGGESSPLPPGPTWPGSTQPGQATPSAPRTPARTTPAPAPTHTPKHTPTDTPTPSRPQTPPPAPRPTTDTPGPPPSTHPAPAPTLPTVPRDTAPARAASSVTVRAGDSLWLLAAHRLGSRAADCDVAAYLPELYAANRSVIGDDPDLVRPGQVLSLPAPGPSPNPQESP